MRKKTLTALCLFLTYFSAKAQNQNLNFKYALKFSNTMQYSYDPHPYNNNYIDKTTTWVKPSLSFIINNKKGNSHELELIDLSINKYEYDVRANSSVHQMNWYSSRSSSFLTLRYQYQQNFLKSRKSAWMPFISIGASFGVESGNFFDEDPDIQKSSFTNLIYKGYLSPGVSYNISKRLFATFSLPITLFDGYSLFGKNSSNAYSPNTSSYADNVFTAFPTRVAGKFSLGIKL